MLFIVVLLNYCKEPNVEYDKTGRGPCPIKYMLQTLLNRLVGFELW